jgi:hypothetical protein
VVAFEHVLRLANSLAHVCRDLPVEPLLGRYEELPMVRSLSHPPVTVDLRSRGPFAAAILGWGSFSHLRSDQHCIAALRQFGDLTHGPILISYRHSHGGPGSRFHLHLGYFRTFTGAGIHKLAESAGLKVVDLDDEDNFYAVLRALPMPR